MAEPCTDCPSDELAAAEESLIDFATATEAEPDAEVDPRGSTVTLWDGFLAPIGKPTGDGRRFSTTGELTHRELPMPLKWQRTDASGHSTSVVVGTMDKIRIGDGDHGPGVYAGGTLFKPDPAQLPRLAEDVAEAKMLLDQKVIGPSVDLDAMEFHAMPGEEGELAVQGKRPEIEVDKGRVSAATLVPIPAFAEARPFTLREMDAAEYAAQQDADQGAMVASVRASGWGELNYAAPDAAWDPVSAVARLREWAGDDLTRYAQAFVWNDPDATDWAGYRFPVADVIEDELVVIPEATRMALARLDAAVVSEDGRESLRTVLEELEAYATGASDEMPETIVPRRKRKQGMDADGDGDGDYALHLALVAMDDAEFTAVSDLAEQLAGDEEGSGTFGARFDRLKASLAKKGISDPGGLAAKIGTEKYGKKGMARLRAGVSAKKVKPLAASGSYLEAMVAAAAMNETTREKPSADLFRMPEADKRTPLTVTDDGRVFGHIADYRTCHTGFSNQCVRAPKSKSAYAYFHTGTVETDQGAVPVGRLSIGGGHASTAPGVGFQAATAHYDDASTAVAELRAVDGKHGIWVSGRVLPQFRGTALEDALRRHPPSGDWRPIAGNLEMVHVLAVNSPGFPIPRVGMTASADGQMEVTALVAAGVVMTDEQERAASELSQEELLEMAAYKAVARYVDDQSTAARVASANTLFARIDADREAIEETRRAHLALQAAEVFAPRFRHGWIPIGGGGKSQEKMHREAAVAHFSPHAGGGRSEDMSDEAVRAAMDKMHPDDLDKIIKNNRGSVWDESQRILMHAAAARRRHG